MIKMVLQLGSYILAFLIPIMMLISLRESVEYLYLFYYPLFAIPVLILLYLSGPLSAAAISIFATVIGICGFLFTIPQLSESWSMRRYFMMGVPFIFLIQTGWLWALFWIAERLIEKKDLEIHQMEEDIERAELLVADCRQEKKEMEDYCGGVKSRIASYSHLRTFTDELASRLIVKEVQSQAEISLEKMFGEAPKIQVCFNLFKSPNSSDKEDCIGESLLKYHIPLLVKDVAQDPRFAALSSKRIGSAISCPIEMENSIIGSLSVFSPLPEKWSEEDLRFLADISNIVSLSIANAIFYERVESLAEKDSLTNLFVRYRFDERAEEEFARGTMTGSPLSLLMLDIDHFKQVNDQWGHMAGDRVLKSVSGVIMAESRETDFCARYGGEEIVVLMPLTKIENAFLLAERIRNKVSAGSTGPEKIGVTVSGGLACVTDSMKSVGDLIESADKALYKAKKSGRNRVVKA